MPKRTDIKSILIIGAGPIVIGQACEFDYSGTQACKALREEGYRIVLVNSNPATIMTDEDVADVVTRVIVFPVLAVGRAGDGKRCGGHALFHHDLADAEPRQPGYRLRRGCVAPERHFVIECRQRDVRHSPEALDDSPGTAGIASPPARAVVAVHDDLGTG